MTGVRDFVLAADLAGNGTFAQIGAMAPVPLFAAAVRALQSGQTDPEFYGILVHAVAAGAAGRCCFANSEIESALQACFEVRLVSEWCITFPGAGDMQALFVIAQFQPAPDGTGCFDLVLKLSSKPVFRPFGP